MRTLFLSAVAALVTGAPALAATPDPQVAYADDSAFRCIGRNLHDDKLSDVSVVARSAISNCQTEIDQYIYAVARTTVERESDLRRLDLNMARNVAFNRYVQATVSYILSERAGRR